MKLKEVWKKFWYLLWKDDSLKGWIFALVFLFIFVKFIFFPILNLATGTTLPLAIVESCSMYHKAGFFSAFASLDKWYERHETKYSNLDISEETFKNFKLKRGLDKGDILFIVGAKPEKVKVGDIIIFESGQNPHPIIHRVIKIRKENEEFVFTTLGDNNYNSFSLDQPISVNPNKIDEKNIKQEQIVGKVVFRITPYMGWVKLIFFEWQKSANERGFCREN